MNQAFKRSRGHQAGIDRHAIAVAARDVQAESLSMQAVAEKLGVNRKALNYHVKDRDGLMDLVAADRFSTAFADVEITSATEWQGHCEGLAHGMVASLIATGELATRLRFGVSLDLHEMRPVEVALEEMVAAGFTIEQAARGLAALAALCQVYVRDHFELQQLHANPDGLMLREMLTDSDKESYRAIRELLSSGMQTGEPRHLEFLVRLWVSGMEQQLLT